MVQVGHMGLTVADLDASIAFYGDVVGFALDLRTEVAGEWFDTLTHNSGAHIDVAMMRMGEFVLQLVAYGAGGGGRLALGHHHVGSPHLSITVDDLDERYASITASGGHHPTAVVNVMDAGIRSFYVTDPDGMPVEFLQMPR